LLFHIRPFPDQGPRRRLQVDATKRRLRCVRGATARYRRRAVSAGHRRARLFPCRCGGPSTKLGLASAWRREARAGGGVAHADASTPRPQALGLRRDAVAGRWSPAPDSRRGGGGQYVESSFDAISHEWLVKFVEHRITDRRVVRLIQKWLRAGVLEGGETTHSEKGTPQGGGITPRTQKVTSSSSA
jgi:hypothetical protein